MTRLIPLTTGYGFMLVSFLNMHFAVTEDGFVMILVICCEYFYNKL